jgi:hypothetical protein
LKTLIFLIDKECAAATLDIKNIFAIVCEKAVEIHAVEEMVVEFTANATTQVVVEVINAHPTGVLAQRFANILRNLVQKIVYCSARLVGKVFLFLCRRRK